MSFDDFTKDDYKQMIVIFIAREFDFGWNRERPRDSADKE